MSGQIEKCAADECGQTFEYLSGLGLIYEARHEVPRWSLSIWEYSEDCQVIKSNLLKQIGSEA